MSTNDDLIKLLVAQNLQLTKEVAELKEQLAKSQEIAPKKSKKAPADPNKPKNPAHVETGKKLVEWNARRKLVKEAFQTWRAAVAQN
jgi:hypothetical protein